MSTADVPVISAELDAWLRETRRYLHMHPELSLEEANTARLVAGHLRELGIEHRPGVGGDGRSLFMSAAALEAAGIVPGPTTGGNGVVALLHGRGQGRTVLIRADMDALPIDEQNQTDYRSTRSGVMHACGHDVHTTILLGVAEILAGMRDQFDGTVKLMFQPAEEGPGGAVAMIHDRVLDDPPVDAALALHVAADYRAGQIGVGAGAAYAAADTVKIVVKGVGGHAARPHAAVDATLVGAQILVALQTIVSREIDPQDTAVITFGTLHAGTANNVIPDTAILQGTVRTYTPEVRDHIERRIAEVASGVARSMRAEATTTYLRGYPSMRNDPALTELVRGAAREVLGPDNVFDREPSMAGEDLAFIAQQVPTCMFSLGVADPARGIIYPPHHPQFDADEDALAVGVRVMVAAALRYLAEA
ncbi:MAG TPA: M20 family metallopeptidase [Thermomicrobiaceae bacterium]|nr:M20 family metallopeptidase [Thermomicrobiaceae bacterium]